MVAEPITHSALRTYLYKARNFSTGTGKNYRPTTYVGANIHVQVIGVAVIRGFQYVYIYLQGNRNTHRSIARIHAGFTYNNIVIRPEEKISTGLKTEAYKAVNGIFTGKVE